MKPRAVITTLPNHLRVSDNSAGLLVKKKVLNIIAIETKITKPAMFVGAVELATCKTFTIKAQR